MDRRGRIGRAAVALAALTIAGACSGGGGGSDAALSGTDVSSGLAPDPNGFAFANFASSKTEEVFGAEDMVKMFGDSTDVCVSGASPCELAAEAAGWARMVNEARSSGHCEGLVVTSSTRYVAGSTPATAELTNEGDVTHAIFRAFATQFLGEVQKDTASWAKKSLKAKLGALEEAFATKKVAYSLGIYTPTGGHAVLPYALRYETPTRVKVMVYDSNWPGQERWVLVDLDADEWSFPFSGPDPANDPNMWKGGSPDLDLTSTASRESASCPFCSSGTKLDVSMFVVRNSALDWSMTTGDGVLSPSSRSAGDATVRPLRAGTAAPSEFLVVVPAGGKIDMKMPTATKITGVTPRAAVEITSVKGGKGSVEVTDTSVSATDPGITITLADGDLVGTSNGETSTVAIDGGTLAVEATTPEGEKIEVIVDAAKPAVDVQTEGRDGEKGEGGYTVVSDAGGGKIEVITVSEEGKKSTETIVGELANTSPVGESPASLDPPEVKAGLPSPEERVLPAGDKTVSATPPALRSVVRPD